MIVIGIGAYLATFNVPVETGMVKKNEEMTIIFLEVFKKDTVCILGMYNDGTYNFSGYLRFDGESWRQISLKEAKDE